MSDIVRPSRTDEPLQEDIKKFNKEYVFIGTAQNKTRDYIKNLEQENKELKNDNAVMRANLIKMCDSEKRELQQRIDKGIEYLNNLSSKGRDCEIYYDVKQEILKILNGYK